MESSAFVIDSSVLVAFYNASDGEHANAVSIMHELEGKTLVIHPHVIQETATVLTYRFGVAAAKKFLEDVRNSAEVIIPPVDIVGDMEYFSRAGKKMSFTDISLVRLAESMSAPLITFDRQMLSFRDGKKGRAP